MIASGLDLVARVLQLRETTKCTAFGECGTTLSIGGRAWVFNVNGELRFACYECAANVAPQVEEVSK